MKKRYGKLVRDKIPELIRANGELPTARAMDTDEYRRELLYKLIEEAEEVRKAGYNSADPSFVQNIADVREVLAAIESEFELDGGEIEKVRKERSDERGGYDEKMFLESVRDS